MATISKLYSRKMEIYYQKKNYEKATNFIIHGQHLIKGSRVITLDKLKSTEIYSVLISKVQNKPPLILTLKICLMTIKLTGQQSICYHTLLSLTPICNHFNTKS